MAKRGRSERFHDIEVEKRIAANLRQARITAGMTQFDLANHLGVTYQQAHKYETAANRIPVTALIKAAAVFDMPVAELIGGTAAERVDHERSAVELMRIFRDMTEPQQRGLMQIARVMAGAPVLADAA